MHEWIQSSLPGLHFDDVFTLLYILLLEEKIRGAFCGNNEDKRNSSIDCHIRDRWSHSVHKLPDRNGLSHKFGPINHLFPAFDDDNDLNKHTSGPDNQKINNYSGGCKEICVLLAAFHLLADDFHSYCLLWAIGLLGHRLGQKLYQLH